jgi:hypothetical protein
VRLVDIKKYPILELRLTGTVTTDGTLHEVDIISIATGFDAVTGGISIIGIKDADGNELSER